MYCSSINIKVWWLEILFFLNFYNEIFRTLAILAHVLADDVEAHLHIRSALDSNDEIEILAAVKAAKKFIPCSK